VNLRNFKRALALTLTLAISAVSFCGCSEDQKESTASDAGVTIDMDNLEYGATLRTDRGNYPLPLQFDKRFFEEDALTTLANYYYSIQTNDAALFRSVQQECFLNYVIGEVYKNQFTVEELVKSSHDSCKDKMGGDYAYALIYAKNLIKESAAHSNVPIMKEMLDYASTSAGGEKISDKITTMYELTLDIYLTEADSGETGEVGTKIGDTVLFLYEYDDAWYVVY